MRLLRLKILLKYRQLRQLTTILNFVLEECTVVLKAHPKSSVVCAYRNLMSRHENLRFAYIEGKSFPPRIEYFSFASVLIICLPCNLRWGMGLGFPTPPPFHRERFDYVTDTQA